MTIRRTVLMDRGQAERLRRLVRINLPSGTPIHPAWLCRSFGCVPPVRALVASCQTGASTPQIGNPILNSLLTISHCQSLPVGGLSCRLRWASGLGLLVLVLLFAGCRDSRSRAETEDRAVTVATVGTVRVGRGPVKETLDTLGVVTLDPLKIHSVPFVRSGQVLRVLVVRGQIVAKHASLLLLGSLPHASPFVRQARLNLKFALRDLSRAKRMQSNHLATNRDVQQAERAVASARATLKGQGVNDASTIDSPFAGIVFKVLVTAGSIVQPGQKAVLLAPTSGLIVRVGFELEDAVRLKAGLETVVRPVFGRGDETPAKAKLDRLHMAVDPQTQLVQAMVHPAPVPGWMVPGMSVQVTVTVRSEQNTLRVPLAAVIRHDGQTGVFVVHKGVAHWTPVVVGLENDRWLEVTKGLGAGTVVATVGHSALRDGMRVSTRSGATPK